MFMLIVLRLKVKGSVTIIS